MIKGCEIVYKHDDFIFWNKNDKILIKQDLIRKELRVNSKYIWSFLENIYELNEIEIKNIISKILLEHTDWLITTPKIIRGIT